MKLRKKGFTLVELLAVILILALLSVVGIYSYASYSSRVNEKVLEIEKSNLIDAATDYYMEMSNDDNYESYNKIEGGKEVSYSCISLRNLISKGFYKEKDFKNKDIDIDKTVVQVITTDGINKYELISDYNADSYCNYWDTSKEIEGANFNVTTGNPGKDEISVSANVSKRGKRNLLLKLNFNAALRFVEEYKDNDNPVYVMIMLDRSGSMGKTTGWAAAKLAGIDLSEKLQYNFENNNLDYRLGLYTFGTTVIEERAFERKVLTDADFAHFTGNTNILAGLEEAHNKFSEITGIKYLIFLSDGNPALTDANFNAGLDRKYEVCKGATKECKKEITDYSNMLKNDDNVTFITIGYNNPKLASFYGDISTPDTLNYLCPNSNYTVKDVNHCYYSSSSDKLGDLFSSISNTIKKVNDIQNVKKVTFSLKFNDSVKVYNSDDKLLKNNVATIDFDMTKVKENEFSKDIYYIINLDDLEFDNSKCDENNVCDNMNVNLFESFEIYLKDKDNNLISNMNPASSSLPYLIVAGTKKSYVN